MYGKNGPTNNNILTANCIDQPLQGFNECTQASFFSNVSQRAVAAMLRTLRRVDYARCPVVRNVPG